MAEENRVSGKELQEEIQSLKADLNKLQGDLQQITQTIVDLGKSSARQAREQARARVETSMDTLEQYIEQRPVATVLTAFAVGVIAGKLFGRG